MRAPRSALALCAVALGGCRGFQGPWEGGCDMAASIGLITIVTGAMGEVDKGSPDVTGEHALYTATEIEVTFPAGDQPDVTFDFIRCLDDGGCTWDGDPYDRGDGLLVVYDVNHSPLIIGAGPLRGKAIEGRCTSGNFAGEGAFTFARTSRKNGL